MICPYCDQEAPWTDNALVYGKRYGKSYMCYWCKDCDAYVGCHNNTRDPLGTMANKELRQMRMKVHRLIDPLWKEKGWRRAKVYSKLNDFFGYHVHMGGSDMNVCKKILENYQKIFFSK